MQNLTITTNKDGTVTITFDPKKSLGPSKSGKTTMIATTSGAAALPGDTDVKININIYRNQPR